MDRGAKKIEKNPPAAILGPPQEPSEAGVREALSASNPSSLHSVTSDTTSKQHQTPEQAPQTPEQASTPTNLLCHACTCSSCTSITHMHAICTTKTTHWTFTVSVLQRIIPMSDIGPPWEFWVFLVCKSFVRWESVIPDC